jgi:hypothetical protein
VLRVELVCNALTAKDVQPATATGTPSHEPSLVVVYFAMMLTSLRIIQTLMAKFISLLEKWTL